MTKVMVVDAGARGHALALAYCDAGVDEVVVAPGNEGIAYGLIASDYESLSVSIDPSVRLKDSASILRAAREQGVDLVDVAQDDVLAAGTVDLLEREGIRVFGPTRRAAGIEWDKSWAREFMVRHNIPHPEYSIFRSGDETSIDYANNLLRESETVFFKASGLYAGKGVVSATDEASVARAFEAMRGMGEAGSQFLVEEGMRGEEFSYYVMTDGERFVRFKSAQDNKRVFNRDLGPNTGGMGANSPALVTRGLEQRIEDEIIRPAISGLQKEGRPYKGILYLGGMVCEDGSIRVVEFNSRWGDPECHVVLPGVNTKGNNYFDLVNNAIDGKLSESPGFIGDARRTRVCVVGASAGYPGDYRSVKGKEIFIDFDAMDNSYVLSAGIRVQDGRMYAKGGRLFSVVGEGRDVIEARRNALQGMACCSVGGNGLHYRTDVAWRDVERVQKNSE